MHCFLVLLFFILSENSILQKSDDSIECIEEIYPFLYRIASIGPKGEALELDHFSTVRFLI